MFSKNLYFSGKMNAKKQYKLVLCLAPVLVFLVIQILRVLYVSPETGGNISGSGDAAYKWDLARFLVLGVGQEFDQTSHHSLRWASWVIAYWFNLWLGDSLVLYSLSTIIPSTLGGMVFVWILSRYVSVGAGILFVFLWMVDQELYSATFMLTPTGTSLLPLSLMAFLLVHFMKSTEHSPLYVFGLAFVCFWLYGVKETNLFFIPGVFYLIVIVSSLRSALLFLAIVCVCYFLESLLLWRFGGLDHIFGRMYELVFESAKHLTIMEGSRIDSELETFYDRGLSSRFYSRVTQYHSLIYFVSAYIAASSVVNYAKKPIVKMQNVDKLVFSISVIYLSFFLLTGFFIVGVDPLTLGQPLRSRYLVVMLPLGFMLILFNFKSIMQGSSKLVIIPFVLISWFVISVPINWAYGHYSNNRSDLFAMDKHYKSFVAALESTDCVLSRRKHILDQVRRWPSGVSQSQIFQIFYDAEIVKHGKKFYAKKMSPTCINNILLDGQYFEIVTNQS